MNLAKIRLMTAMVTPFKADGSIDYPAVERVVDYLLDHGTQGLIVSGTTGEAPTLSDDEKIELFTFVVQYVAGRCAVVGGIGSNNTAHVVEIAKRASQVKGLDALLVVVPYYSKPSQAGMIAHFEAVADASALPIILYNVPGRTGKSMDPETTIHLSRHPRIIGVKECNDLPDMQKIIEETPDDFLLYSGSDEAYIGCLTIGGDGIISVISHLEGDLMKALHEAFDAGNLQEAAKIQHALAPKIAAIFSGSSTPATVKAVLAKRGVLENHSRLPIVNCSEEEAAMLVTLFED